MFDPRPHVGLRSSGGPIDPESRSLTHVVRPSLLLNVCHTQRPMMEGRPRMPAKSAKSESDGFSAEERAAMKGRAAELRAEGKKGAKKADGLQALLDSIEKMVPEDRALAERVHV